jgi:hypothetical protein
MPLPQKMQNILFEFALRRPENLSATLRNLKYEIEKKDGKFYGNEAVGTIQLSGVEGLYETCEDSIKILITKKPSPIIPNKLVENEIRKIYERICE